MRAAVAGEVRGRRSGGGHGEVTDRACGGGLQLVRVHRLDGGAPVRLVVDPVQHVLIGVLTA